MLSENGRVELVVRAAVSYQEILERLERAETLAVIRKGMRQFKRGEGIRLCHAKKDSEKTCSTE